jgi:hypothetical protein
MIPNDDASQQGPGGERLDGTLQPGDELFHLAELGKQALLAF